MNHSNESLLLDAELPEGPQAPGVARRFVARLGSELPSELMDSIVLLVSEVVTNSYRYGATGEDVIGLRVSCVDETIRVEVSDAGGGQTAPAIRQPSVEGGWGLRIVDELSSQWGVSTDGGRRVVWFELSTADVGKQPVAGS